MIHIFSQHFSHNYGQKYAVRWGTIGRSAPKKYDVVEEEIHVEILLSWSDTIWVEAYIQRLLTVTTKSLITSV